MAYVKTTFNNSIAPGISADFLNKSEAGIEFIHNNYVSIKKIQTIVTTTAITTVGSIESIRNIQLVEMSVAYFVDNSVSGNPNIMREGHVFNANLGANLNNSGEAFVFNPNSTVSTRYLVLYYFESSGGLRYLRVILPSALLGMTVKANIYYKEV